MESRPRRDRPLAGGHPLGGRGLRALRELRRLGTRTGLALLALGLLSGAPLPQEEQDDWPARASALLARLAEEPASPELLAEARSTWEEAGNRARALAEAQQARAEQAEALDLRRRLALALGLDRDGAKAALELDRVLRALGRNGDDLEALRTTIERVPSANPYRPFLHHALADCTQYAGRWSEALALLDEAQRELTEAPAYQPLRHTIEALRAKVYLQMGLPDVAAPWLERAREGWRSLREAGRVDYGLWASVLLYDVELAMVLGDHELVVERGEAALQEEALFAARPELRPTFVRFLALAYKEIELRDPSRPTPAPELFRAVLADTRTPDWERLICEIHLAALLLVRGELDQAAPLIESAWSRVREQAESLDPSNELGFVVAQRFRLTLARGADAEALAACGDELHWAYDRILASWNALPERPGGNGFLRYGYRRLVMSDLLRLELLRDEEGRGVEAAFAQLLRFQELGTLARAVGARAADLARIRHDLVPEGGGMLVYFAGKDRGDLFALDGARLVHAELPGPDALLERADELLRWLRRSPATLSTSELAHRRDELERTAGALAAQLFPPAVAALVERWGALTIVSDGLLDGIPFECLPLAGRPLGLEHALGHLPSAPWGLALSEREAAAPPGPVPRFDLCLFAGAEHGEEARERFPRLEPLPLDDEDLRRLTRGFDPARVRTHLGADASVASLAAEPLNATRLLHVLGHGVHDPARARPVGIVLSSAPGSDGLLWSEDVEALRATPRLVILSSCGSGRGPERAGDPASSHLGGAFLASGRTQAVVLSIADTALAPTLALTGAFQHELAGGRTPAEAMLAARRELAQGSFDDPFYWALVRVVGLPHRALFPPRPGNGGFPGWGVVGAGLVALAALAGLRRFRRRT